jgi:hypothetical protein
MPTRRKNNNKGKKRSLSVIIILLSPSFMFRIHSQANETNILLLEFPSSCLCIHFFIHSSNIYQALLWIRNCGRTGNIDSLFLCSFVPPLFYSQSDLFWILTHFASNFFDVYLVSELALGFLQFGFLFSNVFWMG